MLQTELQEHSKRLERLQEMMSSVKLDHFARPNISNNAAEQSQASTTSAAANQSQHDSHKQSPPTHGSASQSVTSYMTVDERQRLLQTMTRRFIDRETG